MSNKDPQEAGREYRNQVNLLMAIREKLKRNKQAAESELQRLLSEGGKKEE